MPDLPNVDAIAVGELFTVVLVSVAAFWSINKAIIIAKSH